MSENLTDPITITPRVRFHHEYGQRLPDHYMLSLPSRGRACDGGYGVTVAEVYDEARARLFAASPGLLDALKAAHAALGHVYAAFGMEALCPDGCEFAAAIAKAEGRPSAGGAGPARERMK